MSNHRYTHLPSPFPFRAPAPPDDTLHVLSMYSNTPRYHSRARLFKEFQERMRATPHVLLWTVEVAFGARPFEVTDANDPHSLQLRTQDEMWHKENALNLLAQRLPHSARYLAWVDGDIHFRAKPNEWALETIHALQHYQIVQLFQECLDLDNQGNVMQLHKGFVYSWRKGLQYSRQYGNWHPGYAWAYTREAWNGIGGLIDFCICGAGDDHMAKCLIGKPIEDTVPSNLHPNYGMLVAAWRDRAIKNIKYDIGYLPTTIEHYYHGAKEHRNYWGRWQILRGCPENVCGGERCKSKRYHQPPFDPLTDLKRDIYGLWQLTDAKLHIRDGIREYMMSRNEDANI